MTVLRCSAKLLKRLKLPTSLPEPLPQANPLGEWYADIDFWHRRPFVVMLNASTGAVLMLNGNAQGLRSLQERAFLQFASLCEFFGIRGPMVDAELQRIPCRVRFWQNPRPQPHRVNRSAQVRCLDGL
jgi:hypothetical protein